MPALPPSAQRAADQTLSIALLGTPETLWDGRPLPLARRQLRALLYRLAAAPQPVPRDQLAFLFWPDAPDATARRNLAVLLNHLWRALPEPDVLVTMEGAVGLRRQRAWSDALAARAEIAAGLRERRLDRLGAAAALYRGPFLDGFSLPDADEFEAWMAQERQAWERLHLAALAGLIEGHTARRDYPAAILAARRSLAIDDLAEEVHRRLIALHAAAGDRAAALRQFAECAATLERELDVRPRPATIALHDSVRDGQPPAPEDLLADPDATWLAGPEPPSAAAPATTLPIPPNPLIGRAGEVAAVGALLDEPGVRLLTLCGPGGCGKTRLALEVARQEQRHHDDGVVYVPLAPLADPAAVGDAIARACGVWQAGAPPLPTLLAQHLRPRHLLLVLDNFEHLLAAAPLVADLLAAAPRLRALVTSRTILNVSGEHTFEVPPLPLPDPARAATAEALAAEPAVALLLARVRAHDPAFRLTAGNAADLAAICARLDGLPLALELAAARLRALAPRELLGRLDHRLALLDRGPRDLPDRHRTLRATIGWSERLLGPDERRLFARLAIFAGGWTLPAAEQICRTPGDRARRVPDGLQALCDAHLITRHAGSDGASRFEMLATIREYALERLREDGEEARLRRRHAAHVRRFAERRAPRLWTSAFPETLGEFDRDQHNLRAALGWALATGAHGSAARLADALIVYWDADGLLQEGHAWCARVLRHAAAVPQPFRARLRAQAGYLAYRLGRLQEAGALAAQVLADAGADRLALVHAANTAGQTALETGDIAAARRHYENGLALDRDHESGYNTARIEFNLGFLNLVQGQIAEAEALFRRSYARREAMGHPRTMGFALAGLGSIAVMQGAADRAARLLAESLRRFTLAREKTNILYAVLACAALSGLRRQPQRAAALFGAALRHAELVGLTFPRGAELLARAHIERARAQLTGDEYDRAWREGRALSFDAAVALALAATEPAAREDAPDVEASPPPPAELAGPAPPESRHLIDSL